ncbi:MAG TPA: class II aldolase/adducin family protein [Actinomycetota bacterium]
MRYIEQREAVCRFAVEMEERGLTWGTAGNVSCRVEEGALVTPSTMPYREITPADVNLMALDGTLLPDEGTNERAPSVEHKVHLACYRARDDVGAVIHAHPLVASAFAAARVPLPSFLDEMGVFVGDEVRVAEYAISGTPDIAENVVKAMGETANAVFLASHGLVACGRDLRAAMHVAGQVERAAQTYLAATMLGGPAELPEDARKLFAAVFDYKRLND